MSENGTQQDTSDLGGIPESSGSNDLSALGPLTDEYSFPTSPPGTSQNPMIPPPPPFQCESGPSIRMGRVLCLDRRLSSWETAAEGRLRAVTEPGDETLPLSDRLKTRGPYLEILDETSIVWRTKISLAQRCSDGLVRSPDNAHLLDENDPRRFDDMVGDSKTNAGPYELINENAIVWGVRCTGTNGKYSLLPMALCFATRSACEEIWQFIHHARDYWLSQWLLDIEDDLAEQVDSSGESDTQNLSLDSDFQHGESEQEQFDAMPIDHMNAGMTAEMAQRLEYAKAQIQWESFPLDTLEDLYDSLGFLWVNGLDHSTVWPAVYEGKLIERMYRAHRQARAESNLQALYHLNAIAKHLYISGDFARRSKLLEDPYFYKILAMLEYTPESPNKRLNLRKHVRHAEEEGTVLVFTPENPAIKSHLQSFFRLLYMHNVVLMGRNLLMGPNDLIRDKAIETLNVIMSDQSFLDNLFHIFNNRTPHADIHERIEKYHRGLMLLFSILDLTEYIPGDARSTLRRIMIDHGLIEATYNVMQAANQFLAFYKGATFVRTPFHETVASYQDRVLDLLHALISSDATFFRRCILWYKDNVADGIPDLLQVTLDFVLGILNEAPRARALSLMGLVLDELEETTLTATVPYPPDVFSVEIDSGIEESDSVSERLSQHFFENVIRDLFGPLLDIAPLPLDLMNHGSMLDDLHRASVGDSHVETNGNVGTLSKLSVNFDGEYGNAAMRLTGEIWNPPWRERMRATLQSRCLSIVKACDMIRVDNITLLVSLTTLLGYLVEGGSPPLNHFLLSSGILLRLHTLVTCSNVHLASCSLGVLRSCLSKGDPYVLRHFAKHDLCQGPLLLCLRHINTRSLLWSRALDFFAVIIRMHPQAIIEQLVERHFDVVLYLALHDAVFAEIISLWRMSRLERTSSAIDALPAVPESSVPIDTRDSLPAIGAQPWFDLPDNTQSMSLVDYDEDG